MEATETTDLRRPVLEAFARVLRLKAHNLFHWPELIWQESYNELQWEGEAVQRALADEGARRRALGARPWFQYATRLRQSGALLQVLEGHTGSVVSCVVAPDGSYVVSAGDETLRIWDVPTGQEIRSWQGAEGVTACAVSPDGSLVVSASEDTTLTIWDLATGRELGALEGHAGPVWACAVSPDESFIVSASEDKTLKTWDAATGRELSSLEGEDPMLACAVSPDGSYVVASMGTHPLSGEHRILMLGDPHTGEAIVYLESVGAGAEDHTDDVSGCAVSPDGSFIVSASLDETLKLWDPRRGQQRTTLVGHAGPVLACSVSPDGSFIVSAGDDKTLKIWDPAGWGSLAPGQRPRVHACAVSPDDSFVVSADDRELSIRDPETGRELRTLEGPRGADDEFGGYWPRVTACAMSSDGSFVVSASTDPSRPPTASGLYPNAVRIWNVESGQEVKGLNGHHEDITACAVSPDGSFIVSAGEDKTLKTWDPATGRELRTMEGHEGPVRACAVSPDGSFIVSASEDKTLKTWNPATGRELRTLEGDDPLLACAVSPDALLVASGGFDGTVRVWDVNTGQPIAKACLLGRILCVAFYRRRPRLACGDSTGNLNLIDLVGIRYASLVTAPAWRG